MVEMTLVGIGKEPVYCRAESGLTIGDQIRQLIGGLTLAYGAQIQAEFIDLDQDPQSNNPLAQETLRQGYQLPALFIGNEVKYQGGVPILALKSLLDELGLVPMS